jgi:hypothetical protein
MKNIYEKKIYKYLSFVLISFIYFFIAYGNRFGEDLFFASGDNYQITDLSNFLSKKYGVWEYFQNGRVDNQYFANYLYRLLELFFNLFKISHNYTSVFLIWFYLFFSFLSFYFSLQILNLNLNFLNKILLSVSYSINFFVFYIFWYTWGYTTTITIYIFIPVLLSLFISYSLEEQVVKKNKILIKSIPIIFIGNIAFGNVAWLLIILLTYFFIFLILNISNLKNKNYSKFTTNLIYFILFIIIFIIFSLGSITINFISIQDIENLSSINKSNLFNWIFSQYQPLPSAFFFSKHFQWIDTLKNLQYLTILNYAILFYVIYKIEIWNTLLKIFFTLLFLSIFFTFKGVSILPIPLVELLFGETLFYALRSEDKSSVMLPYLCITTLALGVSLLQKKKILLCSFILIINIASSYPLVTGGLQLNHGININKVTKPIFKSQKKIDRDIKIFKKITNNDEDYKFYNILETPYSVNASPGWNDFQASLHRGISYFEQFTKFQLINLNSNQYILGKDVLPSWNESSEVKIWDINIIKLLSIKYILHHKDAPQTRYNNEDKILNLEKNKIVEKIYEGDNINIYEVNKKFLNKKIYIPEYILFGNALKTTIDNNYQKNPFFNKIDFAFFTEDYKNSNSKSIVKLIDKIEIIQSKNKIFENKNFDTKIKYKEENLKEFSVINPKKQFYIAYTQNYNKFWQLVCQNCPGNTKISHIKLNHNLNGWKIEQSGDNSELKFKLNYRFNNYINIYFYTLIAIYSLLQWINRKYLY